MKPHLKLSLLLAVVAVILFAFQGCTSDDQRAMLEQKERQEKEFQKMEQEKLARQEKDREQQQEEEKNKAPASTNTEPEQQQPENTTPAEPEYEEVNTEYFSFDSVKLVTCETSKVDPCGVILENCSDGNSYYCVHGVKQTVKTTKKLKE